MNFLFTLSLAALTLAAPLPSSSSSSSSLANTNSLYTTLAVSQHDIIPNNELSSADLKDRLQARIDKTAFKYNVDGVKGKRALSSIPLGDSQGDNSYFTTVMIGTPPVAFELAIDTGSADLIVQTVPCISGCTSSTPLYRPSESETSQDLQHPFTISYQAGGAAGEVYSDILSVGGFVGRQQFGGVTSSSASVGPGGVNGVLGLAFKALSSIGQTPFMEAVYQAGKLTQPIFGVALATQGTYSTPTITAGGTFNLGWTDSSLYSGNLAFNAVNSPFYWAISLDRMIVSGQIISLASTKYCTIDTGTTNIYVPIAVADQIYSKIAGSYAIGNGLYVYSCSAAVNVAFVFGGVSYYMPDSDFNIGTFSFTKNLCYGAISSIQSDIYIVGAAFLKNYYAAFRFSPLSVGFAPLLNPETLKSGSIPTGNGTTIAQGGNVVTPKAVTPVIVATPVIPVSITGTPLAVIVSKSPEVAAAAAPTSASFSIGALATSLQNGLTNLIIEIARNIQNTGLLITCRGTLDKSQPTWVCES